MPVGEDPDAWIGPETGKGRLRSAGLSKSEIIFVHVMLLICLHKTLFSAYLSTVIAFI